MRLEEIYSRATEWRRFRSVLNAEEEAGRSHSDAWESSDEEATFLVNEFLEWYDGSVTRSSSCTTANYPRKVN